MRAAIAELLALLAVALSASEREALFASVPANGAVLAPYLVPQNPGLGPNPFATMHGDSWLSDTTNYVAPTTNTSTIQRLIHVEGQCYTSAFNRAGDRLVLLCHTIPVLDCFQESSACSLTTGTKLVLVDRSTDVACWNNPSCQTFTVLDSVPLNGTGRAAGIYFYIDQDDNAVVANLAALEWYPVGSDTTSLEKALSYDLSSYMVNGDDMITSAFPAWDGLVWFESNAGVVGTINLGTSAVKSWVPDGVASDQSCPGVNCPTGIVKGFSIDSSGVYVITNSKLIKFTSGADGMPAPAWSLAYDRGSAAFTCDDPGCGSARGEPTGMKPGMQSWGSGTSPKLFGANHDLVAIANNADERIAITVVTRSTGDVVCQLPVFPTNASATTTSFVGHLDSLYAVNDFGMVPGAGGSGAPGFVRVDVVAGQCVPAWNHADTTNTGCLKLSTFTGLVYNNVATPSALSSALAEAGSIVVEPLIGVACTAAVAPIIDAMAGLIVDRVTADKIADAVCSVCTDFLSRATCLACKTVVKAALPRVADHAGEAVCGVIEREVSGLEVDGSVIGRLFVDNYVLARDARSGALAYKYALNNGRIGELDGWTFFVSNQIGPAGELYVGTFNGMKVLNDPTAGPHVNE